MMERTNGTAPSGENVGGENVGVDADWERLNAVLRAFRERLQVEEGVAPSALAEAEVANGLWPPTNGATTAPVEREAVEAPAVTGRRAARSTSPRTAPRSHRRPATAPAGPGRRSSAQPKARPGHSADGTPRVDSHRSAERAASSEPGADRESELRSYLEVLWRRRTTIALTVVLTVMVALLATLLMRPVYAAATTLQVSTASNQLDRVDFDTLSYAERRMNTYIKIATSQPVLGELARRLGVADPPAVKAESPANTELLRVTVEDANPEFARRAAGALGEILVGQLANASSRVARDLLRQRLAELEQEIQAAGPDARSPTIDAKREAYAQMFQEYERTTINDAAKSSSVAIVEPASLPLAPARPNRLLNLGLGLLLGLVAGVGLAFLSESLDTRLHLLDSIQRVTRAPVLGLVPATRAKERALFDERSPQQEAIRRIRTHLVLSDREAPLRTVMLTSADPGEGKSTIAANLAASLARARRNVLAIDADLRLPTLHRFFGISNESGLSRVLQGEAAWVDEVRYEPGTGVWVMPSGPMPSNPAELLGSAAMAELLERLSRRFDVVLIDTPSLLAVADGSVLTPMADAVVLVVAQGLARAESVRAACQELANVGVEPLVVVNRADGVRNYGYYPQAARAQGA